MAYRRPLTKSFHESYPRLYRALIGDGHDAAKAIEILLEAKRGDKHSLAWCKMMRKIERKH